MLATPRDGRLRPKCGLAGKASDEFMSSKPMSVCRDRRSVPLFVNRQGKIAAASFRDSVSEYELSNAPITSSAAACEARGLDRIKPLAKLATMAMIAN